MWRCILYNSTSHIGANSIITSLANISLGLLKVVCIEMFHQQINVNPTFVTLWVQCYHSEYDWCLTHMTTLGYREIENEGM